MNLKALSIVTLVLTAVAVFLYADFAGEREAVATPLADDAPLTWRMDQEAEPASARTSAGARTESMAAVEEQRISSYELLLAFGWGPASASAADPRDTNTRRAELLGRLELTHPVSDDMDGADTLLAALQESGIAGGEQATALFDWGRRPEHRVLTRGVIRALVTAGPEGEALAGELALEHRNRFRGEGNGILDRLAAEYALEELAIARAANSAPSVRVMLDAEISQWSGSAGQLSGLSAGDAPPPGVGGFSGSSPQLSDLQELANHRARAVDTAAAYLKLGDPGAEDWALAQLRAGQASTDRAALDIVTAALTRVVPEDPKSSLARRLEPWLRERIADPRGRDAWSAPLVDRCAVVLGDAALPYLIEAADDAGQNENAVAALLQLAEETGSEAALDALFELEAGDIEAPRLPENQDLGRALYRASAGRRFAEDGAQLLRELQAADAERVSELLGILDRELLRTAGVSATDVEALVERFVDGMQSDPYASLAAKRCIDLLVGLEGGIEALERLSHSPSGRVASAATGTLGLHRVRTTEDPAAVLAALEAWARATDNPFREVEPGVTLWTEAIEFARDGRTLDARLASWCTDRDLSLWLRVALYRGLVRRGSLEPPGLDGEAAAQLARECRAAANSGADWAPSVEPSHWKSVVWSLVRHPVPADGIGAGTLSVAEVPATSPGLPSGLAADLQLLERYLEQ